MPSRRGLRIGNRGEITENCYYNHRLRLQSDQPTPTHPILLVAYFVIIIFPFSRPKRCPNERNFCGPKEMHFIIIIVICCGDFLIIPYQNRALQRIALRWSRGMGLLFKKHWNHWPILIGAPIPLGQLRQIWPSATPTPMTR